MIFKVKLRSAKHENIDFLLLKEEITDAVIYYNSKFKNRTLELFRIEEKSFYLKLVNTDDATEHFSSHYLKVFSSYLYNDKGWEQYTRIQKGLFEFYEVNEIEITNTNTKVMENQVIEFSKVTDVEINHVRKINVQRYKGIKNINVTLGKTNLLIGGNNSGKSSLLQAIHLGFSCIQTLHKFSSSSVTEDKLKNYKAFTTITYDELAYKPIENFRKLGYKRDLGRRESQNDICIEYIDLNDRRVEVSIESGRARGNSLGITCGGSEELFKSLTSSNLNTSYYVTGLSGIPGREELKPFAVVKEQAVKGASNSVFRNIIYLLSEHEDNKRWLTLQKYIREVFPGKSLVIDYNKETDIDLVINVMSEDVEIPIDSMGTSFLQFVQMVSYILLFEPQLIIIDEPDAHLHPNNQKIIMDLILEINEQMGTQLIISTHSKYIIEHLHKDCEIIWMENGGLVEFEKEDITWIKLMSNLGALDKGAKLSSKLIKCFVLTEDSDTEYIYTLLASSNYNLDEVDVWSYEGCTKIETANAIAGYLTDRFGDVTVIIHLDRDFIPDADIADLYKKYNAIDNIELFITDKNDIEAYFVNIDHILEKCEKISPNSITIEEIDNIIIESTEELFTEMSTYISVITVEYCLKNNMKNKIKEKLIESNSRYFNDKVANTKGKLLLRRVEGKLQNHLKKNVNLNYVSEHIQVEKLQDISRVIWPEFIINQESKTVS